MKLRLILSVAGLSGSLLPAPARELPVETVVQTGHYAAVSAVAFSRNGKLAATGSADKTVKLWETATGREIRSYMGHTREIRCLAFGHADSVRFRVSGPPHPETGAASARGRAPLPPRGAGSSFHIIGCGSQRMGCLSVVPLFIGSS